MTYDEKQPSSFRGFNTFTVPVKFWDPKLFCGQNVSTKVLLNAKLEFATLYARTDLGNNQQVLRRCQGLIALLSRIV